MDGRSCRCGRRGCVEAYVGVPGLIASFVDHFGSDHPYIGAGQRDFVARVRAGLEAGDDEAAWLIGHLAHYLGAALANLVNVINPERVVLTSWTADAIGAWLVPPTEVRMRAESIAGSAAATRLVTTQLTENPVALGMATLALESFLESVGLPSRSRPLPATI